MDHFLHHMDSFKKWHQISEGHSQTVQSAANDILSSYWPVSELPLPLPLFSPPCKRAGSLSIIAPPPPCEAVLPEDVHLLFLYLTGNCFSFFPSPQCIGWRRAPTLRMRQRETQPNSCLTEPMWQTPRSTTALPSPPSPHISPPLPLVLFTTHCVVFTVAFFTSLLGKRCLSGVLCDGEDLTRKPESCTSRMHALSRTRHGSSEAFV